ncbi:MAG: hypothetical protein R6U63_12075 [Longimicrobiales bacterium]
MTMSNGAEGHARGFPRPVLLIAAGAVLLRLLLLLGRGDYLAFDEGWYLLLARSLFTGDGYSLVGFPHTALSPLFPVLAGAAGAVLDSWVWGGRLVAAVASGLVVLPAWAVFRRLAPERTALVAAALVAVLPSLAPFVVPFWIGADLWVGAEPLLHLFLYTGVALWLRADEGDDGVAAGDRPPADSGAEPGVVSGSLLGSPIVWWLGAGAVFGLAFLARPEAIITWGLLGLVALGLAVVARSPRRLYGAALMGVGFLLLASPYWLYIHDVSGQWSLTGRGVSLAAVTAGPGAGARPGAARTIERMLWEDDEAYRDRLYGLDDSGLRLRSDYWGVQPDRPEQTDRPEPGREPPLQEGREPHVRKGDTAAPQGGPGAGTHSAGTAAAPGAARGSTDADSPSALRLYVRSMGQILPLLLWLFVVLGAAQPRSRAVLRRELPVTLSLVGTSVAIAAVVAVDPRTQIFLVPLLALYAARGFSLVEAIVRDRWPEAPLRPGFMELLLAGTALVWLLGIDARRLYLSLSLGSPHHIVAEQNRAVAGELDALLEGDDGPVASWHPAIAVYADRDWRVLPYADLPAIVRYLDDADADAMVLSAYYPPDLGVENLNTRYLVLPVPETDGERRPWRLELIRGDTIRALGGLEPVEPAEPAESVEPD